VPTSARARSAEQQFVRACHAGLDARELRDRLLPLLRQLMSVDAAFFATADPETLLFTSAYPEAPLDAVSAQFLDNEYGEIDVNRFTALAASTRHVAWLDDATHDDRMSSSRYRDIMRPLGLGDELRAALMVDRSCWGYLCLHREDRRAGFTEAEAATIARLGPHIAAGLRQSVLMHTAHDSDAPAPGVVLLADDLSVLAVTAEAEQLLALLEPGRSHRLPLPIPVYTVVAALTAVERGTPGSRPPSIRVPTLAGVWLNVHASRLSHPPEQASIAVVVEPAAPAAAAAVLLSAHGLTGREIEVATLVLRGASTRAVCGSLHLSRYTVQDHLKAVFDKVGVRSRRELVAQLLGTGGSHHP
jgi:DNA-binding CsgD family transcriptional regulator